jgi:hypothetical protein
LKQQFLFAAKVEYVRKEKRFGEGLKSCMMNGVKQGSKSEKLAKI